MRHQGAAATAFAIEPAPAARDGAPAVGQTALQPVRAGRWLAHNRSSIKTIIGERA
jgi:hypothetical protein